MAYTPKFPNSYKMDLVLRFLCQHSYVVISHMLAFHSDLVLLAPQAGQTFILLHSFYIRTDMVSLKNHKKIGTSVRGVKNLSLSPHSTKPTRAPCILSRHARYPLATPAYGLSLHFSVSEPLAPRLILMHKIYGTLVRSFPQPNHTVWLGSGTKVTW